MSSETKQEPPKPSKLSMPPHMNPGIKGPQFNALVKKHKVRFFTWHEKTRHVTVCYRVMGHQVIDENHSDLILQYGAAILRMGSNDKIAFTKDLKRSHQVTAFNRMMKKPLEVTTCGRGLKKFLREMIAKFGVQQKVDPTVLETLKKDLDFNRRSTNNPHMLNKCPTRVTDLLDVKMLMERRPELEEHVKDAKYYIPYLKAH